MTFVEGVLWQVYSFDQWGVELGKRIAKEIAQDLARGSVHSKQYDPSTEGLMQHFLASYPKKSKK